MDKMHGVLKLEDVLDGASVEVEGYVIDAVVSIKVIQHGSKEFEIEELEVETDIRIIDKHTGAFLGYVKYNEHDDSFKAKFESTVELLALEKARNTSEELWDYKLVD